MVTQFIQAPEATIVTGIGTSEIQVTVSNFKTISGATITQAMIGSVSDYVAMTLSPRTNREEQVLAKVNSVSGNNVVLDILRAVNPVSPYNVGGGVARSHNVNDTAVISDNPVLFNKLTAKDNNETVTANWVFTGNNTHSGTEIFSNVVDTTGTVLRIAPSVANNQPYTKLQSDTAFETKTDATTKDNQNVKITGAQNVAGVKTFSNRPIVPDAVNANEPFTKGQFEAAVVAAAATASPTVRGTTKIDIVADTPVDPIALTATANRVNALSGGGPLGTPSGSNKFLTQDYIPFISKFGGDEVDGALTLTSGTTNIDVAGARVLIKNYSSISITGTGTLTFSNPHANGTIIIIKCKGNFTITSSVAPCIDASGMGAIGVNDNDGNSFDTAAIFGISAGGANRDVSTGGVAPFSNGRLTNAFEALLVMRICPLIGGGAGGGGNGMVSGGGGGGALLIEVGGSWNFTTVNGISVAGKTGIVGPFESSGGGGGGMFVGLYNSLVSNSGTINVAGGVGVTGTLPTGGGGGASPINNGVAGSVNNSGAGGLGFSHVGLNKTF